MFMEFGRNHLALKFCRVANLCPQLLSSCSQDGEPAVVGCKFRAEGHGLVKVEKFALVANANSDLLLAVDSIFESKHLTVTNII